MNTARHHPNSHFLEAMIYLTDKTKLNVKMPVHMYTDVHALANDTCPGQFKALLQATHCSEAQFGIKMSLPHWLINSKTVKIHNISPIIFNQAGIQ